jgi:hypothetical protein
MATDRAMAVVHSGARHQREHAVVLVREPRGPRGAGEELAHRRPHGRRLIAGKISERTIPTVVRIETAAASMRNPSIAFSP